MRIVMLWFLVILVLGILGRGELDDIGQVRDQRVLDCAKSNGVHC